jgi:hypothetical protein
MVSPEPVPGTRPRNPELALDPTKFFTGPHYNGFPAVLVNLPAVTVRELKPLITEAWRCKPQRISTQERSSGEPRAARSSKLDNQRLITGFQKLTTSRPRRRLGAPWNKLENPNQIRPIRRIRFSDPW